jgi:hypothetical protein
MVKAPMVRKGFRYDVLQSGDVYHSRSTKAHASVIAYAQVWERGREGRRAAREAVKDPWMPNHSGTILERHGQRYVAEATPKGYVAGDLDEYLSPGAWFVRVYRWRGYEDPARRDLCARALERWCRQGQQVRYDLWGAILSTALGQRLVGWMPWARNCLLRWFCGEGAVGALCISGVCGDVLDYDIPLPDLHRYMELHRDELPATAHPLDVMRWQERHADMEEIDGYYIT